MLLLTEIYIAVRVNFQIAPLFLLMSCPILGYIMFASEQSIYWEIKSCSISHAFWIRLSNAN